LAAPAKPADIWNKAQQENAPLNTEVTTHELFLHLSSLFVNGAITAADLSQFVTYALIHQASDYLFNHRNSIKSLYNVSISKTSEGLDVKAIIAARVRERFSHLFTAGALRRELAGQIENAKSSAQYDSAFNPNSVEKIASAKNSFSQLVKFYNLFDNWTPEKEELEAIVLSAFKDLNKGQYALLAHADLPAVHNDIIVTLRKEEAQAKTSASRGRGSGKKGQPVVAEHPTNYKEIMATPLYRELLASLTPEFVEHFRKVHHQIVPLSKAEIDEYCTQNKFESKHLKINPHSLLPDRVCCARECGFFLRQTSKRLNHHMIIWGSKLPSGFHSLVKANHAKTKEEIFEAFLAAHPSTTTDTNGAPVKPDFGRSDAEILDYIEKLKTGYTKILG
jgi:hypothetical protein